MRIGANIDNPTPEKLAKLAIESTRNEAGMNGKDGISYLLSRKEQGVSTPLMQEYENEILRKTATFSLQEAFNKTSKGKDV